MFNTSSGQKADNDKLLMDYQERNEQSKSYKQFRTSLDFGMGILYIIIGAMILYLRFFGTMQLSATYAYMLGGLMLLYGAFRIYRGAQSARDKRRNINRDFPDLTDRNGNL